ncbi:MAG: histidinol-phosphate aminotransferase family protein [Gammaproteobacteria bacterium]|nr:histidinol-phosphate aminotransferase family protein [Gammaproteobacteria bacterium]
MLVLAWIRGALGPGQCPLVLGGCIGLRGGEVRCAPDQVTWQGWPLSRRHQAQHLHPLRLKRYSIGTTVLLIVRSYGRPITGGDMGQFTRRQILLSGGALLSTTCVPGLARGASSAGIVRPQRMIRADKNENPYGPSRVALQAINEAMDLTNKYGVGHRRELVQLVADINEVPADHVILSAGSGEILKTGGLMASWDKGSIVCADPTYHDLVRYAGRAGSDIIRVPVDENMAGDLGAIRKAIRSDTVMVYLVNPNNPTPTIFDRDELRDFVLEVSKDRIVFVDEAYFEYVEDPRYGTLIDLVAQGHKNIIVARTASKIHGLAGLRVGFGFAHPDHIQKIRELKTGVNNVLGIEAAYASYQDMEFQDFARRKNRESMAIVEAMFEELGLRYVKSPTNFTFFETGIPVEELNAELREHGILSGRPFPPFTTWSRVSMARPEEMRYYVQTFKKLFASRIMDSAA